MILYGAKHVLFILKDRFATGSASAQNVDDLIEKRTLHNLLLVL